MLLSIYIDYNYSVSKTQTKLLHIEVSFLMCENLLIPPTRARHLAGHYHSKQPTMKNEHQGKRTMLNVTKAKVIERRKGK